MLEVGADVAAMRQMFSIKAMKVLPWKDRENELKTDIELLRMAMNQEMQSARDVYSKLIATGKPPPSELRIPADLCPTLQEAGLLKAA